MCPVCLAMSGLYNADGVSAGAVTTFLATKLLRKRPEPTASTTLPPKQKETTMAATDDRVVHRWRGPPSCCSMKERNND